MERIGSRLSVDDRDIGRQDRVERAPPRIRGERSLSVEMYGLTRSVHAGVGPTRRDRDGSRSADTMNRGFDCPLNRGGGRLTLPAVVVGPVVLDGQANTGHSRRGGSGVPDLIRLREQRGRRVFGDARGQRLGDELAKPRLAETGGIVRVAHEGEFRQDAGHTRVQ